jgi:hypothetical protein
VALTSFFVVFCKTPWSFDPMVLRAKSKTYVRQLRSFTFTCVASHPEQALASPYSDNSDLPFLALVHNAKGRMDQLAKVVLAEFRNSPAHVRIVAQGLGSFDDFRNQTLAYFWN